MKRSKHVNQPKAQTYLLLLQCCTGLLPPGDEREKAEQSIFRSCCKDGLVNQQVLKAFQGTVSTDTYNREVVRDAPMHNGTKSLPEKWTRNLGFTVMTQAEGGVSKRSPIISVDGEIVGSTAFANHRMKRRLSKKNQKLLQGGRRR